jgi:hypothetical protein
MRTFLGLGLLMGLLAAASAVAGPEKVALPKDYRTRFTLFSIVDRPDLKGVRFAYVNPEALQSARPGQPVPDGTVLVMETRKAKLDPAGQPVRDADGRFVATDEVMSIFMQEKHQGWGAEYPPEKRNGEWEYAWYTPDGSRKTDVKLDFCFTCHKSRTDRDYTFLFWKHVVDTKR